jgi:hypothetical protein
MSKMRPAGLSRRSHAATSSAPRSTSGARDKSQGKWFNLFPMFFMTGARRERLQNTTSASSFAISSMNDFPIPEDPPVMTTAVYDFSSSLSEGTTAQFEFSSLSPARPYRRVRFKPNHTQ